MQPFKFEGLQVGLRSPCLVLKIRIPGNQIGGAEKIVSFRDAVLWRVCSGPGGSVEDEKNRDSAPLLIFSAPPADRAPLLKSNHFQCWSRFAKTFSMFISSLPPFQCTTRPCPWSSADLYIEKGPSEHVLLQTKCLTKTSVDIKCNTHHPSFINFVIKMSVTNRYWHPHTLV